MTPEINRRELLKALVVAPFVPAVAAASAPVALEIALPYPIANGDFVVETTTMQNKVWRTHAPMTMLKARDWLIHTNGYSEEQADEMLRYPPGHGKEW